MQDHVWIVIAAYREEAVIREVVSTVVAQWPNVVVVDDGSGDATAEQARLGGAQVLIHPVNLGQGAALATGIRHALIQGAQYIVTYDADGQHSMHDIERLVQPIVEGRAQVAIGSRFLGEALAMPASRKLLLKAAVLFTWLTAGVRMTDAHNGLRCFSAAAARQIRITQNRMAHASEIIEEIGQNKLSYIEVPVTIRYTEYSMAKGQSMSNSLHIVLDLLLGRLFK